jgi:endonuclease/exonuclease/phosphatase family metal-dependent hydrolase
MVPSLLRLLLFVAVSGCALAQSIAPLRVATYNLLKYPDATVATRNAAFRTVVSEMRPHVLVAQEVESAAGVSLFLDDVLDASFNGRWEAAPFLDVSSDTEGAFFYDTTRVTYLGMEVVRTPLRGIFGYRFTIIGSSDTVWIFTVHLKASDSQDDAQQRAEEARLLRVHLDSAHAGEHVIVAGDFNVYRSTEPALVRLLGEEGNANARLIDPISSVGDWHANPAFAAIHTQSPRVRQFGQGVIGGMDDRFDMILVSTSLSSIIDRTSYRAYGNDGQHFNDSINRQPNTAVFGSVAQALHDASDHLPVFVDFTFGPASVLVDRALSGITVAPIPARERVTFELPHTVVEGELTIYDIQGYPIARVPVARGAQRVTWECADAPPGLYAYALGTERGRAVGTITVTR